MENHGTCPVTKAGKGKGKEKSRAEGCWKNSRKKGQRQKCASKPQLVPENPENAQLLCLVSPGPPAQVTVASDCSGLCTEVPATKVNLPADVTVQHIFASENDPKKRTPFEEQHVFRTEADFCHKSIAGVAVEHAIAPKEIHHRICQARPPGK